MPGTDTPACSGQVQLRAPLLQLREKLPCGGGVAPREAAVTLALWARAGPMGSVEGTTTKDKPARFL